MKYPMILAAIPFVLLVTQGALADDSGGIPGLKKEDFRIIERATGKSIALHQTLADVIETFGNPKNSPSLDAESNQFVVSYDGLKVWYLKEGLEITTIRVNSPSFSTPRGVSVGDPIEFLLSKYGKKEPTKGVYNYEYYPPKADQFGTYSFVYEIINGRISSILIYLAFDY